MSDTPATTARPTRTAVQGGVGWAVAVLLDEVVYDFSDTGLAALTVVLAAFLSWAQVMVENHIGHGFLRDVPPKP